MRIIFLSILFLPLFLLANEQNRIDSLQNELQTNPQPDKFKLSTYYRLAQQYQKVDIEKSNEVALKLLQVTKKADSLYWATYALDVLIVNFKTQNKFDSCVKYLEEAIQISKEINKPYDVAYFQSRLSDALVKLGKYYDALQNYQDAIEYAKKAGNLVNYEAAFINNIGGIYHFLGDDLKALDYFLQSYQIKKNNNLTDKLTPSLINIASVYSKLEKFDEAIKFHVEALTMAGKDSDLYNQMKALTGLGYDYYLMREYGKSENNYLKALPLSDSINDLVSKANILAKLSNVYYETGDIKKAIINAKESLNISRKVEYSFGISSFARTLGDLYCSENKFSLALPLLKEAIDVSEKSGEMENLKDSYMSISNLYEKINDADNSLKYYRLYSSINDSLLRHEEADKYTVVQIKYEMEKKARDVENLTHENEIKELKLSRSKFLLFGFIILFSLVFLFLILFIRQNKIRNTHKNVILEQKLLRSQMNPHFIFNTLIAIQKYIHDKSSMLATDYLGRFSKLMRFILSSSSVEQISLEDEISFLEDYIKLQALRFENKFDYELKIDPEIEPEEILITPMLIQPFVENAIEHGLKPLKNGGKLKIEFRQKSDYINVVIEDNGVGRIEAAKLKEQKKPGHKSMAMNITKERLVHINKKSNRNIKFKITDLVNNSKAAGTRVELDIPFSYA